jgi:hypothetical protein
MTAKEFKRAFDLAKSNADLSDVDDSVLHGCALPGFEPVTASIEAVAAFIRWQARYLNGRWNDAELTDLQNIFRRKVTMLG